MYVTFKLNTNQSLLSIKNRYTKGKSIFASFVISVLLQGATFGGINNCFMKWKNYTVTYVISKHPYSLYYHIDEKHHQIEIEKHSCDTCAYSSQKMSKLLRHKQARHELIRHSCNVCDFQSSTKDGVRSHNQVVHEGTRYSCQLCSIKTTTQALLRNHVKAAHEGITFSCNICDFLTPHKNYITRHKKSVHEKATS